MIFLITSIFRIESKRKILRDEIKQLTSELQLLKGKNDELKKIINKTKSESYWEEKAREEGYVKEGEEVIVIKKIEEKREEKKPETIWQRMINFFQK